MISGLERSADLNHGKVEFKGELFLKAKVYIYVTQDSSECFETSASELSRH